MKKMIIAGLSAFAVFATGCSKDHDTVDGPGTGDLQDKASVHITINGENASSRAIGTPTTDQEKTVHSFTVYVFNNATGVLEASETFDDGLEGTISGLGVASTKKVVVFVNPPEVFTAINTYKELTLNMVELDTQVPGDFSTSGLFMSGEATEPVKLSTTQTVTVPVTVSRLTSKVRLGSLTVTPDEGLSLDDFVLSGVTIQNTHDRYNVVGRLNGSFGYIGGIQLPDRQGYQVDYLREQYQLPQSYVAGAKLEPNIYFYVFPSVKQADEPMSLNFIAAYKGKQIFFPFHINDKQGTDGSTTDGKWVGRNKIYTLNVTLRKIASGGEDPNVPNEQVSMDVKVDVADWEDELIQDIEW